MVRRLPTVANPRLDWRNPAMPVIRDYRMSNGERKTEVEPDYEQRYREHLVYTSTHPNYRTDPTYDLKRKR